MNNSLLIAAHKWLNELGIKTEVQGTCLAVNREDVLQLIGGDANEAYGILLSELKESVSKKLFWGGVASNDTWAYLESF